jgi:septum formation protein
MPVDIDESIKPNENANDYCQRLALEKALAGWHHSEKNYPVIGSDTIVVFKDEILGKPTDENDAFEMLMKLSNNRHQVMTAVAIKSKNCQKVIVQTSEVTFDEIDEQGIHDYIATKEPMDKAGSYGIQGLAAVWIKHISGSHSGIMGLPLYETAQLIKHCDE